MIDLETYLRIVLEADRDLKLAIRKLEDVETAIKALKEDLKREGHL